MENICIIGKNGMLGSELMKELENVGMKHIGFSHKELDICNYNEIEENLNDLKITHIVNCSAMTDTAKCETKDGMILSYDVNVKGVCNLSRFCYKKGIHFIHISTDYVHSEKSDDELDEFPVNVYGCHKLLAEKFIKETIKNIDGYSILRCSWLYGKSKKKNFVDKIMDFCRNSKDGTIKVVDDCFGRPSSVEYVSKFIIQCIIKKQHGIIDAQINKEPISRFDFAKMIVENAKLKIDVIPVKSSEFPTSINQPKKVKNSITDDSLKYSNIVSSISHSDDYNYWLEKYLKENY